MLRVSLLGGLALTWGKAPLPTIPSVAARSLLAYLLTYRDRPHTRDLLAGAFWPDLPDAVARRRLSQALWQIRKALAPHDLLLTKGDAVQIHPDLPLWLDIEELEKLADWELGALSPNSQFTNLPIYQSSNSIGATLWLATVTIGSSSSASGCARSFCQPSNA